MYRLQGSADLLVQPNPSRGDDLLVQSLLEERVGEAVAHDAHTGLLLEHIRSQGLLERVEELLLVHLSHLLQGLQLELSPDNRGHAE